MKVKLPTGKTRKILIAAGLALLSWLLGAVVEFPYFDTDSFWLSMVMNGLYGSDTYTIFVHPWLCWFVGAVARLLPTADAYLLLARGATCLALGLLFYLFLSMEEDCLTVCARCALLLFGTFAMRMWNQNFTVQAVFFAVTACASFYAASRRKGFARAIWAAVGTVYACLGYMWRWEAAALVLPFAALVLCARWMAEKGRRLEVLWTAVKIAGVCVLCIGGLYFVRERIDTREVYREDYAYNYARSSVQDFPLRDWEEVADDLPEEIAPIDYIAMTWWVLFDTDHINTETMSRAAEIGAYPEETRSLGDLYGAGRSMFWTLFNIGNHSPFLMAAALLLLLRLFRREGSVWYRVAGFLSPCGAALIILYFTCTGRAPARVWEAVLLGNLAALLLLNGFMGAVRNEKLLGRNSRAIILLSVFFAGSAFYMGDLHRPRLALFARTGYDESEISQTFRGDDLYIWDTDQKVWYHTVEAVYAERGKLLSPEFMEHNLGTGSWLYGQHFYNEYLERIGVPNPAEALLFRDHTYLVSRNTWVFEELLRAHYGDVTAEKVGEIRGNPVWRLTLTGADSGQGDHGKKQ